MNPVAPFPAEYRLTIAGDANTETGSAMVTFAEVGISVAPKNSTPIDLHFSDISAWKYEDYCVTITLTDGTAVELLKLARRGDEFIDTFRSCRQTHFMTALLLEEGEQLNFAGAFEYRAAPGEMLSSGSCLLVLQKTSLACFPDNHLPFLVPYGLIREALQDQALYGVKIACGPGESLALFRLARRTDELARSLDERRSALAIRQSSALAALAPQLGAIPLRRCAALLRDGVPVEQKELEGAAPGFWETLWQSGFCEERRSYAEALLAKATAAYVVLKETGPWGAGEETPAALADRRLMYLFQIGDALVLESPANDDAATYIFRITGEVLEFTQNLCRALSTIQFRREPIYLPAAALDKPPHNRYAEALRILPALADLRRAFMGRAVHKTLDSWLQDVNNAVAKTVTSV